MNSNLLSDAVEKSIAYYDRNAQEYLEGTANLDMESLYAKFLRWVPNGGHILDAGCGSGRDTRAFLDRGYKVTAFDASAAMVVAASQRARQQVLRLRFEEMAFENEFDGVWACASLLHIPRSEIASTFPRFVAALKPDGVWYMSFKQGSDEGFRSGRLFNDYSESSLRGLLPQFPALRVVETWVSADVRPGRKDEMWVNAIAQKLTR